MKTRLTILFLALSAFSIATISGCDATGPGKSSNQALNQTKPITNGGTIVFRDKDGDFYGILADNGGQYEPLNLDTRFHNDGMRISFTGHLDTTRTGTHQWGNPIDLAVVTAAK